MARWRVPSSRRRASGIACPAPDPPIATDASLGILATASAAVSMGLDRPEFKFFTKNVGSAYRGLGLEPEIPADSTRNRIGVRAMPRQAVALIESRTLPVARRSPWMLPP